MIVHASSDETIRIGLVGCGGRGNGACAQALQTAGPVELVAIGDLFADHLAPALEQIKAGVKDDPTAKISVTPETMFSGFDAYKRVIDSGVDLVILTTPPGFRPAHYQYAVERGKHVFMEKPVAVDAAGVNQILEATRLAKEKNLKVGVGLMYHYDPRFVEIMQRIQEGAIGEVLFSRVYYNAAGVWEPRKSREECQTEMEYQTRNWYYYCWLSGDHIVEQHIHNIDIGCWLRGITFPVEAVGMGGREVRTDPKYGDIYDHHNVEFTFADGTKMFSACRHVKGCWNSSSAYATGTKGTATIFNPNSYETYDGKSYRVPREVKGNPYQIEHDVLFSRIRNNEFHNEAEMGAMSTMTTILGRMATYSGKVVKMDAALASNFSLQPLVYEFDAPPPVLPTSNGTYPIAVPGVSRGY